MSLVTTGSRFSNPSFVLDNDVFDGLVGDIGLSITKQPDPSRGSCAVDTGAKFVRLNWSGTLVDRNDLSPVTCTYQACLSGNTVCDTATITFNFIEGVEEPTGK